VKLNKYLILLAILVFGVAAWSVAQNKADRVAKPATAPQAPQTPQAPQAPEVVIVPAAPEAPMALIGPTAAPFAALAAPAAIAQAPDIDDLMESQEAIEESEVLAPPQGPQVYSFSSSDNYLGVYTEPVTSENQATYGLREARGVAIKQVAKESPAEKAGLQKDDVILRFDNEPVTSVRKLNRLIDEAEPGHTAQLTISRHGVEQQVSVKLGKRSNGARVFRTRPGDKDDDVIRPFWNRGFQINPPDGRAFAYVFGASRRIGIGTSPLTKQLGEYFGVRDGGVLVSSVNENGPAFKAGVKAGDIITEVDGVKINSAADLMRELGKKKDGDVTLTIVRDKSTRTVKVTPEQAASEFPTFEWPQVGDLVTPEIEVPLQLQLKALKAIEAPRAIMIPRIKIPRINLPELHELIVAPPMPPIMIL
jgi:membrane-associated protease RseP (regulator of RpoE activity)